MVLVHLPRISLSIGKGLLASRNLPESARNAVGLGLQNMLTYEARTSLLDIDQNGHMNQAAYLQHAEYARWELCAHNGTLSAATAHGGFQNPVMFFVTSTAVRYRKEIKPLWKKFIVESCVANVTEEAVYFYHVFRYPSQGKGSDRIRAQVLVKGKFVQRGTGALNPINFLNENFPGINLKMLDEIYHNSNEDENLENLFTPYEDLEAALRSAATLDDSKQQQQEREK